MPAPYATQLEWLSEFEPSERKGELASSSDVLAHIDHEIELLEGAIRDRRAMAAEIVASTNRKAYQLLGEERVEAALVRFAKKITQGTCQTTEVSLETSGST